MSHSPENVAAISEQIRESPKYRHVDAGLVEQVVLAEIGKRGTRKEIVKSVRRKLHQVTMICRNRRSIPSAEWCRQLEAAAESGDKAQWRAACLNLMQEHASCKERSGFLSEFYDRLLVDFPAPARVLDLACGLNPLARPWMHLAEGTEYLASDVLTDVVDFLNRVFAISGTPGRAECWNLLKGAPPIEADVAFLFKTLPSLEQLSKGIGRELLASIQAPVVLVSFPTRSIGGAEKGMREFYTNYFVREVMSSDWEVDRLEFPNEIVFRLRSK